MLSLCFFLLTSACAFHIPDKQIPPNEDSEEIVDYYMNERYRLVTGNGYMTSWIPHGYPGVVMEPSLPIWEYIESDEITTTTDTPPSKSNVDRVTQTSIDTSESLLPKSHEVFPMFNTDRGLDVMVVSFSAKDLLSVDSLLDFFSAMGNMRNVIGKRSVAPRGRKDLKAQQPAVNGK